MTYCAPLLMLRHSGPQGRIEPFTIVDDPSAWLAEEYKGKEDTYIHTLTAEDIKELDAAIALVEKEGLRIEVWPNDGIPCSNGCAPVLSEADSRLIAVPDISATRAAL